MHPALESEKARHHEFPVTASKTFLAHAGVAPLPRVAAEALREFAEKGSIDNQEGDWVWPRVLEVRKTAAELIGCGPHEIALLGPTSLGLNLVANGLPWEEGDEVIFYIDDYPANAYPWLKLKDRGVTPVSLQPEVPGRITPELVEAALTDRTRLVALASCNFLSGYRIDVEAIGRMLRDKGVLFSVDGIQTLGAFPMNVEYVDFLSADSHKWMLGPVGAGIFYVRSDVQDTLHPTLLGAWNVESPDYVAREEIVLHKGSRRYEPGTLNIPGVLGMGAALRMLLDIGIENVADRLLALRKHLLDRVRPAGWRLYIEEHDRSGEAGDHERSGIVALAHPDKDLNALFDHLLEERVVVSLRRNRAGEDFLRVSPHFYNTEAELDRLADLLG